MALSIFDEKSHPPTDHDVEQALGKAHGAWTALWEHLAAQFSPLAAEWGYAGKAYGWGLRLKKPKRTVLYMTPCAGYFLASMSLGEKAVLAARTSALSKAVLAVIDSARKYAEGRAVRLQVRTMRDLADVELLVAIRMEN